PTAFSNGCTGQLMGFPSSRWVATSARGGPGTAATSGDHTTRPPRGSRQSVPRSRPGPSGPRVEAPVDLLQVGAGDMGVDLGAPQVGVAQHHLNGPEVGPPLQEV